MMLKKMYLELVLIRKELQAIRSNLESRKDAEFIIDRVPYGRGYRVIPKPRYKAQ